MLEILLERISPNESICMEDEKESKSASVEETADTDFLHYNPCLVMHYNNNNDYKKESEKKVMMVQNRTTTTKGSHHNMDISYQKVPTTTWMEQRVLLNCSDSWSTSRDKIHVLTGKEIIVATPE